MNRFIHRLLALSALLLTLSSVQVQAHAMYGGGGNGNGGNGGDGNGGNGSESGCTHTQGFWKGPLGEQLIPVFASTGLDLGDSTYTSNQLIQILETNVAMPGPGANALLILAHQLIAAKLNILAGAAGDVINATILAADTAIDGFVIPPVGGGNVAPNTPTGQEMVGYANTLTQYNEGLLGVPHCDDEGLR